MSGCAIAEHLLLQAGVSYPARRGHEKVTGEGIRRHLERKAREAAVEFLFGSSRSRIRDRPQATGMMTIVAEVKKRIGEE